MFSVYCHACTILVLIEARHVLRSSQDAGTEERALLSVFTVRRCTLNVLRTGSSTVSWPWDPCCSART